MKIKKSEPIIVVTFKQRINSTLHYGAIVKYWVWKEGNEDNKTLVAKTKWRTSKPFEKQNLTTTVN